MLSQLISAVADSGGSGDGVGVGLPDSSLGSLAGSSSSPSSSLARAARSTFSMLKVESVPLEVARTGTLMVMSLASRSTERDISRSGARVPLVADSRPKSEVRCLRRFIRFGPEVRCWTDEVRSSSENDGGGRSYADVGLWFCSVVRESSSTAASMSSRSNFLLVPPSAPPPSAAPRSGVRVPLAGVRVSKSRVRSLRGSARPGSGVKYWPDVVRSSSENAGGGGSCMGVSATCCSAVILSSSTAASISSRSFLHGSPSASAAAASPPPPPPPQASAAVRDTAPSLDAPVDSVPSVVRSTTWMMGFVAATV